MILPFSHLRGSSLLFMKMSVLFCLSLGRGRTESNASADLVVAEWDNASGLCDNVDAALLGHLSTFLSSLRRKVDFIISFISATPLGQVI
jgi:hypothetical protein